MSQKEGYMDFEEYIRQGEPDEREKASIWQTAIGLQAVDGLKTSDYLKETARKHIEGDIDIDQARELIKTYYQSKSVREPDNDEKQEADKGIDYSPIYLERFFRNLLLGEQWDLRNRYLHINPTKEWSEQPSLNTPASTPASMGIIGELVRVIGGGELSVKQIMDYKGLKDRKNFVDYHLSPAIKEGLVEMKYPDSPRHPRQKYILTAKGLLLFKELGGE